MEVEIHISINDSKWNLEQGRTNEPNIDLNRGTESVHQFLVGEGDQ